MSERVMSDQTALLARINQLFSLWAVVFSLLAFC